MHFMNFRSSHSPFASAPDREQRRDFQFAAGSDGARGAAMAGEQPSGSGGVDSIQRIAVGKGLPSDDTNANDVHVASGLHKHAASRGSVPLGGRQCHEHGVRNALWFSPNRVDVGVDFQVALEIAQFSVVRVHFDGRCTHIVHGHGFRFSAWALGELSQLLQNGVHALGFRSQRLNRLFNRDVALFQQVGGRRYGRNPIAQGVCHAA